MGIRKTKTGKQHHRSKTPEWRAWRDMLARCRTPTNASYPNWGGTGISVCERWNHFANFFEDMGERPSASHSIDRFPDPFGNYEPSNCRWATKKQQARNRRSGVKLTESTVTEIRNILRQTEMSHGAIAKKFGVSRSTISHIKRATYWLPDVPLN